MSDELPLISQENLNSEQKIYATLDLGSNSFHILIARVVHGSVQVLFKDKERVQLAAGLDRNNLLSEEAMKRGEDCLKRFAKHLKDYPAESINIVATHTLRVARNAQKFIDRVSPLFPSSISVISGKEEARLIYTGVSHSQQDQQQKLVIDIGGGSTEFIIGKAYDPIILDSLKMGCVSFQKRFFDQGHITEKNFKFAINEARQKLTPIIKDFCEESWRSAIGCSGTIKALYKIAKSEGYINGEGLTLKALEYIMKDCISFASTDRIDYPKAKLDASRQAVLPSGLAILIAAFRELKIDRMSFSEEALREGILFRAISPLQHNDIRELTATSLSKRYHVDISHARRVKKTALHIFDMVKDNWGINNENNRSLLLWSAVLHEVGLNISFHGIEKHSAYILQYSDLPGFSHEDQQLLSFIVRFQRRSMKRSIAEEIKVGDLSLALKLTRILRIAILFQLNRQSTPVAPFKCQVHSSSMSLSFLPRTLENDEILNTALEKEANYLSKIAHELTFY